MAVETIRSWRLFLAQQHLNDQGGVGVAERLQDAVGAEIPPGIVVVLEGAVLKPLERGEHDRLVQPGVFDVGLARVAQGGDLNHLQPRQAEGLGLGGPVGSAGSGEEEGDHGTQ